MHFRNQAMKRLSSRTVQLQLLYQNYFHLIDKTLNIQLFLRLYPFHRHMVNLKFYCIYCKRDFLASPFQLPAQFGLRVLYTYGHKD